MHLNRLFLDLLWIVFTMPPHSVCGSKNRLNFKFYYTHIITYPLLLIEINIFYCNIVYGNRKRLSQAAVAARFVSIPPIALHAFIEISPLAKQYSLPA